MSVDVSRWVELLDQNSHIIFPVLAVVVLALLAGGILLAWRSQDLDGVAKAALKEKVVLEIRKELAGVSAEALGRAVGLEPFKLAKLLEELRQDGVLVCHTNTQRLTVWQLKGYGPAQQGAAREVSSRRGPR